MHFQVKWTVRLDVVCFILSLLSFLGGWGEKGVVKFIWCASDGILLHVKTVLLVGVFRFQINEGKVTITWTSSKNRIENLH